MRARCFTAVCRAGFGLSHGSRPRSASVCWFERAQGPTDRTNIPSQTTSDSGGIDAQITRVLRS
jgi:hypothetical protein